MPLDLATESQERGEDDDPHKTSSSADNQKHTLGYGSVGDPAAVATKTAPTDSRTDPQENEYGSIDESTVARTGRRLLGFEREYGSREYIKRGLLAASTTTRRTSVGLQQGVHTISVYESCIFQ